MIDEARMCLVMSGPMSLFDRSSLASVVLAASA